MFTCDICKASSDLGEKPIIRVIESREKIYEYGRYRRKKVTRGQEIVREAKMCTACGSIYDKKHPVSDNKLSELKAA